MQRQLWPLLRIGVLASALALGVTMTSTLSACKTGDQACTKDSAFDDLDDDCPYGPPDGLRGRAVPCAVTIDSSDCEGAWDDAFALFTDPIRGCVGCHGVAVPPSIGLTNDPEQFFGAITKYEGTIGTPYVDAKSPEDSWMLCNLLGREGGGDYMPPENGLSAPPDVAVVERWARCGFPGPAPAETSGAGGAGGK